MTFITQRDIKAITAELNSLSEEEIKELCIQSSSGLSDALSSSSIEKDAFITYLVAKGVLSHQEGGQRNSLSIYHVFDILTTRTAAQQLIALKYLCSRNQAFRDPIWDVLKDFRQQNITDPTSSTTPCLDDLTESNSPQHPLEYDCYLSPFRRFCEICSKNKLTVGCISSMAIIAVIAIITLAITCPWCEGREDLPPPTPENSTRMLQDLGPSDLEGPSVILPPTAPKENSTVGKIPEDVESNGRTTKNPTRSFKGLFRPPKTINYTIDKVKNLELYLKAICNGSSLRKNRTTINIALQFDLAGPFSPVDLSLNCTPLGITGLSINSYISLDNLHLILQTFANISVLKINAQPICNYADDHQDDLKNILEYSPIIMDSLTFFKIENLTSECTPGLEFITQIIKAPNVKVLVESDFIVQFSNLDLVNKFPSAFPLVEEFSFAGRHCPKCELFVNPVLLKWTSLKALNFIVEDVLGGSVNSDELWLSESAQKSVGNLLQRFYPSLEYFQSNVAISKGKTKMKVMPNLQFLNATVAILDKAEQFSARYFVLFPNLRESFLKIVFKNDTGRVENGKKVAITNLKKYVGNRLEIDPFVLSSDFSVDLKPYTKEWGLSCRNYGFQIENNKTRSYAWRLNGCKG